MHRNTGKRMKLVKQQLALKQRSLDSQRKRLLLELEQTKNQLAAKQREILMQKENLLEDPHLLRSKSNTKGATMTSGSSVAHEETRSSSIKQSDRHLLPFMPSPPPAKVLKTERIMETITFNKAMMLSDPRRKRPVRRADWLKDQSEESGRSSDSSMSPQLPSAQNNDDSLDERTLADQSTHTTRNAALQRTLDSDLHVLLPEKITLEYRQEIFEQAEYQLRTGKLTRKQHQEISKMINQLFEEYKLLKEKVMPRQEHPTPKEQNGSLANLHGTMKEVPLNSMRAQSERSQLLALEDAGAVDGNIQIKPDPTQPLANGRRHPMEACEPKNVKRLPSSDLCFPSSRFHFVRNGNGQPAQRSASQFSNRENLESPPPGREEPPSLRGWYPQHGQVSELSHLRQDSWPNRRSHPFHPSGELHEPHRDGLRRSPSPQSRGPPPAGWIRVRRPLPPPAIHPQDEKAPEWDRPMGRKSNATERHLRKEDFRLPTNKFHTLSPRYRSAPPVSSPEQVNVNKLLSDLVGMGVISGSSKPKSSNPIPANAYSTHRSSTIVATQDELQNNRPTKKSENQKKTQTTFKKGPNLPFKNDAHIPTITFDSDLTLRHEEIVKSLHAGIQCSTCGMRFPTRELYRDHLDWHYSSNKKEKFDVLQRGYYPSERDWITHDSNDDLEKRSRNVLHKEKDKAAEDNKLTESLTGKAGEEKCKVCNEYFNTFYHPDDDAWQFSCCIKIDGNNFHPICYEDYEDPCK